MGWVIPLKEFSSRNFFRYKAGVWDLLCFLVAEHRGNWNKVLDLNQTGASGSHAKVTEEWYKAMSKWCRQNKGPEGPWNEKVYQKLKNLLEIKKTIGQCMLNSVIQKHWGNLTIVVTFFSNQEKAANIFPTKWRTTSSSNTQSPRVKC